MRKIHYTKLPVFLVFLLSTSLRVMLAMVNREANDNHFEVIQMILKGGRLPKANDCWECFQPKFFYYTSANILRIGNSFITNTEQQIITIQLLNALVGAATIWIAWAFLKSASFKSEWTRLSIFALTALNPKLIGINSQITNDTWVIFFTALAVYFAWLFFKDEKPAHILACILFISMGIATKTSALPAAAAILAALMIRTLKKWEFASFFYATLFLLGVLGLSFFSPLTQYRENYRKFGSIITIQEGMKKQPFPGFFEKSYVARPGIISIQDGIFTFKYISLLEYPRLTNGPEDYPAHRTSLWTQIYARTHSVHFDNWPDSWGSTGEQYFILSRAIYIFALPFTLLFLSGAGIGLYEFLRAAFRKPCTEINNISFGLFDITFWGYTVFIVLFALNYRDFSVMKAVFTFPASLAFIYLFAKSINQIEGILPEKRWFAGLFCSTSAILAGLYVIDIGTLTMHLNSLLK